MTTHRLTASLGGVPLHFDADVEAEGAGFRATGHLDGSVRGGAFQPRAWGRTQDEACAALKRLVGASLTAEMLAALEHMATSPT
jgi:hypothetical protein